MQRESIVSHICGKKHQSELHKNSSDLFRKKRVWRTHHKRTTIIRNFKFQRQIFKPIEFDVFKIKQDYHFANVRKIITREDLFPKWK